LRRGRRRDAAAAAHDQTGRRAPAGDSRGAAEGAPRAALVVVVIDVDIVDLGCVGAWDVQLGLRY
jgi:hypothetical protein